MRATRAGLLSVLGVATALSALAVTRSGASLVASPAATIYPVAVSAPLAPVVGNLRYTPATSISAGVMDSAVSPSWQPSAGSVGQVTRAGDLALIDTTTSPTPERVTIYVTNLAALAQDYSSFLLPVRVYTSHCDAGCVWTPLATAPMTYLTSNAGDVSFTLPPGAYYDVTLEAGGSYVCTSTTVNATAALAPNFYFALNAA
jgi:hypothetical protein